MNSGKSRHVIFVFFLNSFFFFLSLKLFSRVMQAKISVGGERYVIEKKVSMRISHRCHISPFISEIASYVPRNQQQQCDMIQLPKARPKRDNYSNRSCVKKIAAVSFKVDIRKKVTFPRDSRRRNFPYFQ